MRFGRLIFGLSTLILFALGQPAPAHTPNQPPHQKFEEGELKLESGDRLVLYTDGITEAESRHNEEFGIERVKEIMIRHRARSAEEIQRSLMQAVAQHCEERFHDDATVVVIAVQ